MIVEEEYQYATWITQVMGFCTRDVVGKMGGPVLGDEGVVAPRELPERRIPQACVDVLATVWH